MDLQDIFVHVLLEVQDFVVKVRNYINTFSESFLNVTVSTKDEEIAFQDDKKTTLQWFNSRIFSVHYFALKIKAAYKKH